MEVAQQEYWGHFGWLQQLSRRIMDLGSASLVGGSLMIVIGSASTLWSFITRRRMVSSSVLLKPPPYWYGFAMVALGVGLAYLEYSRA